MMEYEKKKKATTSKPAPTDKHTVKVPTVNTTGIPTDVKAGYILRGG